jgi:pyrimidine operon attenuation protein/uracil phosphoribosyltransferase
MTAKRLYNENDIRSALNEMAQSLVARVSAPKSQWVLVGIHRRGVPLARRLAAALRQGLPIPDGILLLPEFLRMFE